MDDNAAEDYPLTDTPRRPKPTSLDLPRPFQHSRRQEDSSPETPPSYSSVPLPLSPRGPAIADIPLSPEPIYHNVRKTTGEPPRSVKPSPLLASPENDALTPLDGGHPPALPLKLDNSSDVDDLMDELTFDQTVSSGFFGSLGEGGFRSTPITVGVCPTPQPVCPTPQPAQGKPDDKVSAPICWVYFWKGSTAVKYTW